MKKLLQEVADYFNDQQTLSNEEGELLHKIEEWLASPQKDEFLEALCDIVFTAGARHYHSGDSREDIDTFIKWTAEFELINKNRKWDGGRYNDYMEEIDKFAVTKIEEHGSTETEEGL